jgi:hypothetical protein
VPVEPSDVRDQRERTLERVTVGLDHPGGEDVVGEAAVDIVRPPARTLVERSDREDPAVAHGHRLGVRLCRVHRDDRPGRIHGDVAHRPTVLPALTLRLRRDSGGTGHPNLYANGLDASGEEGCDLAGDQVEVVEIGEVEHLEVHALGAELAP